MTSAANEKGKQYSKWLRISFPGMKEEIIQKKKFDKFIIIYCRKKTSKIVFEKVSTNIHNFYTCLYKILD